MAYADNLDMTEDTKLAVMAAGIEAFIFDNVRGFAEARHGVISEDIYIEGRIPLAKLAEFALRRARQVEGLSA